ncbi:MAG: SURF1 family protein [Caldilineaceae bacterium]|nr:SURF1 family protein [Caldilineaceae bacterium]MBP8109715.1 SURF1 family protein [Caldilineaceae bacterium]MBP8123462.1 SURF1 family protein [Caldilineaceae bacterium]MBP9071666.1 SURF1 family protein [Caldilineaceae bacterium]
MTLSVFKKMISRQLWWVTLLVLALMVFFVRMGLWQLDRMQEKQAYNALVVERYRLPVLTLPGDVAGLTPDELAYRQVTVSGTYAYADQMRIRGQFVDGELGQRLITPLVLADGSAVLVDRGWVPYENLPPADVARFDEGPQATVLGTLRPAEPLPAGITPETSGSIPPEWTQMDVAAMDGYVGPALFPLFIHQEAEPDRPFDALPLREEATIEMSAGTHLSYAVQWFSFALLAGFSYFMILRMGIQRAMRKETEQTT